MNWRVFKQYAGTPVIGLFLANSVDKYGIFRVKAYNIVHAWIIVIKHKSVRPDLLVRYVVRTRIRSSGHTNLSVRLDLLKSWQRGPVLKVDTGKGTVTFYAHHEFKIAELI